MNISEKFKASKAQSGMTQEQVAESLGANRRTVSNREAGKTKSRQSRLIIIAAYLLLWGICVASFRLSMKSGNEMIFSIAFLWVLLPVTTAILSFIIGRQNHWQGYKWYLCLFFGAMYMLSEYATFSTANMVSFSKFNLPDFSMMLTGAAFSAAGMAAGSLLRKAAKKKNQAHKKEE